MLLQGTIENSRDTLEELRLRFRRGLRGFCCAAMIIKSLLHPHVYKRRRAEREITLLDRLAMEVDSA